ncbi:polysaccharide deacetylase family protein [Methylocapsa sp. S129]|uniref:polysaccharide deacetylase family protein n=1 Tax=Methylocapsa sp. S129 TaxID=1641869 RepID=UPI00131AA17F|nr:polysaccharide deacetylase family protein [Methylocapsa sp. S129]
MGLKDRIIGAGFTAFRLTGLHRLAAAATQGQGAVLMLHNVRPWRPPTPGFTPNRLLEITPEFLDATLGLVKRMGFDLVTLDEALNRLAQGGARPFVALTFDDGYRDTVDFALPILERHQAPFTVYVATGFADRTAGMWWLELEEALRTAESVEIADSDLSLAMPTRTPQEKSEAFARIYWALRASSEERLLRIVGALAARNGVDGAAIVSALCMDWTGIAALARHPLATIGAHTISHKMLAKWPDDVVRAEMLGSKERIEEKLGQTVRHFAYPVGDPTSAGQREFALAREFGFASAVTTRPGMIFPGHGDHLTALPRVSVNGNWQDIGYFEVLLSGAPFALWNRGRRVNAA